MIRKQIEIPKPRIVPWELKPLSSAEFHVRVDKENGLLHLSIKHDILKGVTPKMLVWWFNNMVGDIVIEGKTYPRYHVWHPIDHISIAYIGRKKGESIGPGSRIHIQEAFGGNPDMLVNTITTVHKLDETGFIHSPNHFGLQLARMHYTFTETESGTLYENSMTIGSLSPWFGPLFNRFCRPGFFSEGKGKAWIKHNIEEVGCFEFFLPQLYASRNDTSLVHDA